MDLKKFKLTKPKNFEVLVRQLTRVIKKNTKYNDDDIIIMVDNMINVLITTNIDDPTFIKLSCVLVYLYTTSELDKINNSYNIFSMFKKCLFK